MLNKLLFHNFPNIKSWLTRLQYELISMLDKDKNAIFMNFGYSSHHKGNETLPLEIEDEIAGGQFRARRRGKFHHAVLQTKILYRRGFLNPRHRFLPQSL